MRHLAWAALQLLFFWVFLSLYLLTMVPLAVVVAFLPIPAKKRERK